MQPYTPNCSGALCISIWLWFVVLLAILERIQAKLNASAAWRSICVVPTRSCDGPKRGRAIARLAGLLILLFPRDGDVAGKDGVPEMGLGAKNGKLHGGIFFVVRDRKEQRVPLKTRSAIHGDDIKRHDRFFELVSHARDRSRRAFELNPANSCHRETFDADTIDRHEELVLPDLRESKTVRGHRKCLIIRQHDAVKEIARKGKYGSEVERDAVGPLRRIDQFRPETENIWSPQRGWRTHRRRGGVRLLVIFMAVTRRRCWRCSVAETGLVLPVDPKHADVVTL